MNILLKPFIAFLIPAVICCESSNISKVEENTKEIPVVEQRSPKEFYEAIQKMKEQLLENLKSLKKTIVEVEVEE